MQCFGQLPGDPFGNPFEEDPLNDPLDPFNDPFEGMSNPLTGDAYPLDSRLTRDIQYPSIGEGMDIGQTLDHLERGIETSPPIRPGPDDLGKTLDQLEENIENLPPIRPGPDKLGRKLDRLEERIENLPPEGGHIEPEIHMPQHNPVTFGKGTDDTPPLPYYLEDPQIQATRSLPRIPNRRIGRRGGTSIRNSHAAQSDQTYCPIERDFVSVETCEDCEYYDEDSDPETGWRCTYHDDGES